MLCGYSFSLFAQLFPKFIFTHTNNNKELPTEACSYLLKDSKGFLWISTLEGLCRYDGKSYTIYSNQFDDNNSIANNNIGTTVEDKEGNIWISHNKGISCLSVASGKAINFFHNATNSNSVLLNNGSVIRINNEGVIFNTNQNGEELRVFDKALKVFKPLFVDTLNDGFNNKNLSNKIIGTLSKLQQDGSMYLQSKNGIFLFDTKTYQRKRVCASSIYEPLCIFKDHAGKLWQGEWDGGLSLINETAKIKRNIINNKRVAYITEYKDLNGKYWLLASEFKTGSIIILDPETNQYRYQLLGIENEITSNMIPGTIYCDDEGRVFVTTAVALLKAEPVRQTITNVFTYKRGKPTDIFYDNLIRCGIRQSNGNYIFGLLGYNGLRIYDSTFNFRLAIKNYICKGKKYDLDVRSILNISKNKYLLSGKTGIAVLENDQITPLQYQSKKEMQNTSPITNAREMLPIDADRFWVRIIGNGVSIFNIKLKKFTAEYTFADNGKKISLAGITNIIYDKDLHLWISDQNNIFLFDSAKNEFIKQSINSDHKYLSNISNIYFDSLQNLWISGEGGLLKYELKTKKYTFLTIKNGLDNNSTFKVKADKQNNIWILHQNGISNLNTPTNNIKNYNKKDGLPLSYIESDGSFFIDEKNNLFAGNTGVITKINIDEINKIETKLPQVIITGVEGIDSNTLIKMNDKNIKQVNLNIENFPANIFFSIIDYSNNGIRNYYYRYVNKDSAWIECKEGVVPINTVLPGKYIVQTTGSVNKIMAQNIDTIIFIILPKWYQTLLFKITAFVFSFSILLLFFKWRLATAKKTSIQQMEIQRMAAEQYKNQLELSQISNYFASSHTNINTEEEVLWDVLKNLISKLGFADCIIYLWNDDKTGLVKKAGYGDSKSLIVETDKFIFPGQGVVGCVAESKDSILINDTKNDSRYSVAEIIKLSKICVPILFENVLLGVIDSEHNERNFFTNNHLLLLNTIASHTASKLIKISGENALQKNKLELANTINQLKGAQLDALRSQMNPHFIFNSLNSIENYILKNKRLIASVYLGKFAKLIRNILENSKSETIPLSKEIETLQIYIELELLRTGNSFDVVFELGDSLMHDNIMLPPMLMQPHVENAILHGLRQLENRRGKLVVSIKITNDEFLEYSIEDNGIGRKRSIAEKSFNNFSHKSYGIDITQNRIDLYKQKNNLSITYTTIDLYNDAQQSLGTRVIIIIPL